MRPARWLDVGKRDWSDELLPRPGSTARRCRAWSKGSGRRRHAARRTGGALGHGQPASSVAGGAGDNAASACGIGAIAGRRPSCRSAPRACCSPPTTATAPTPESAVHAFCHAMPDTWHQMGVILSATDSAQLADAKITGRSRRPNCRRIGRLQGAGQEIFLPYLSGERTPHNNAGSAAASPAWSIDRPRAADAGRDGGRRLRLPRQCQRVLADAPAPRSDALAVGGGSRSRLLAEADRHQSRRARDRAAEDGDFGGAFGAARLGLMRRDRRRPAEVMHHAGPPARPSNPTATPRLAYAYAATRAYPALSRALSRHQGGRASDRFLQGHPPVKFEGPDSDQSARLSATTTRTRWCWASGWRTICASPSPTGTPSPGRAATRSAADLRAALVRQRWKAPSSRPTSPSRCSTCSAFPSTASTTPTCARRRNFAEEQQEPRRDRRLSSPRRGRPASSCSGAPPTCSPTAATWPAPRPTPTPTSSPMPPRQVKAMHRRHPRLGGANYVLWGGREGYETLLNTDLKRERDQAGRFLSTRRRVQAQDRLQGRDPDRAEAAGADQAPVRLRRRHGLRLPQGIRAGEGSEGQHRAGPRLLAGHSFEHETGARRRARHLRVDRHEPQRLPVGLGHRPVPQQPPKWRWPSTRS
jgi:hypothetical protein